MAKWIEYTGSDEQIEEINNARYGILAKNNFNHIWPDIYEHFDFAPIGATEYLICQPHPYVDLIKIWADTGCEVWVKEGKSHRQPFIYVTDKPDWNIPGAEYRLTQFRDEAEIKSRLNHLFDYDPSSPNGYD